MCSSSPPPAPSNITQTTIPEYAKPYVETLLGKAEALTDVTKTPYQTYGGDRIAGQSQEQKDITTDILAQTMPGQFATGTNLASTAGLAAAGAGADYAKMATSATEQAKYMTPYMQNVVEIQKQEAIRDAQRGNLAQNLAAARQGTYGGSRQLLSQLERERNLGDQLAKIQATGSQSAYDRAQQAMQFGTEAGLKGAQAATQAGATLGQLGIGQQQTYGDFAKLQSAAAAQDQAERQREMDLKYQDFISQQQDPYKRLGFMSDILRGSANLAGTGGKTVYEQSPSLLSQITGPGLLGLGLYREMNK
jgi:hypothetical protein